jgi:hypothetical protein
MLTKKSLPRRTVLRGLGASVALPLLDAMVPAATALAKTAAAPIRRLGVVYEPNGMAMEYWTPKTEGAAFPLSPILQPLAAFQHQMIVVSGLRAFWTPAHAGASTTFLTGAAGVEGETAPVADISMDQIVAREFGRTTELASLELAIDGRANAGQCSGNHSCVYTNTISWRSKTVPLPMENNPRIVFERMFGDARTLDSATRLAGFRKDRSVLDSVVEKVGALKRQVGPSDHLKLDEYLEGVRDVERRIQKAEGQGALDLPAIEQPAGIPASFDEHMKLMFDLQRLAYQTDLTRVITFMTGREVSSRTYPEIGVPDAWHPLSHHEDNPERIALMSKINVYHAQLFAYHLEKLRDTPDGDGSLFDHVAMLYGCGMSNSNSHSPINVPIVVAGGAAGRLAGGRHLRFANDPPLANLLVTLMEKLGVEIDRIGNSNGRIALNSLPGV